MSSLIDAINALDKIFILLRLFYLYEKISVYYRRKIIIRYNISSNIGTLKNMIENKILMTPNNS